MVQLLLKLPRRKAVDAMRHEQKRPPLGFTLTELLIVMVIISILVGFIMTAAMDGVRRAEERATQSLITKLDTAMTDRIEAQLLVRADITAADLALATIFNSSHLPLITTDPRAALQRAQVIAQYEMMKAEFPDVFAVVNTTGSVNYPINFAALPFPPTASPTDANFTLPFGTPLAQATGMYGASFAAAGGIYKNLGYLPQGYDGTDNNGNGLIDEMAEGAPSSSSNFATVTANLAAHKHKTARAEMLYALLVVGRVPLFFVFNRAEFTEKEVRDTDGDGLPEFVDAWG